MGERDEVVIGGFLKAFAIIFYFLTLVSNVWFLRILFFNPKKQKQTWNHFEWRSAAKACKHGSFGSRSSEFETISVLVAVSGEDFEFQTIAEKVKD